MSIALHQSDIMSLENSKKRQLRLWRNSFKTSKKWEYFHYLHLLERCRMKLVFPKREQQLRLCKISGSLLQFLPTTFRLSRISTVLLHVAEQESRSNRSVWCNWTNRGELGIKCHLFQCDWVNHITKTFRRTSVRLSTYILQYVTAGND